MPDKSDEDIRKSIKKYEEELPEAERNPNVEDDTKRLIERASRPLPVKPEKQQPGGGYTDTQTHSHKTEDTSD
jgi:hypothetical protein